MLIAMFALTASLHAQTTDLGGGKGATDLGGGKGTTDVSGSGSKTIEIPNLLKCSAPGKSDLECIVDKIFTFLWVLAFPIATIMILIGAYQIMTSQGNEEKVTAGKNTIQYAIIGFVVLVLARSVVYIITGLLNSLSK